MAKKTPNPFKMPHSLVLNNLAETESFGVKIGEFAEPGDIITLEGDLGAGKTTLTQFIGLGLQVPKSCYITSPTFSLLHEYPGRLPMYHFDMYRLQEEEIYDLGFEDYFYGEGLCVIEWPNRMGDLIPADRLHIDLKLLDENSRMMQVTVFGQRKYKILDFLSRQ